VSACKTAKRFRNGFHSTLAQLAVDMPTTQKLESRSNTLRH
jgi:hypothetical protein